MVITRSWNEATPDGSKTEANTMDTVIHNWKQDTREQLTDGDHLNIFLTTNTGARHVATNSNRFPMYDTTGLLKVFRSGSNIFGFGDGVILDDVTHERIEVDAIPDSSTSGATTVATISLEPDSTTMVEATYLFHGGDDQTDYGIKKIAVATHRFGPSGAINTATRTLFEAEVGYSTIVTSLGGFDGDLRATFTPVRLIGSGGTNLVLLLRYWRVD